MPVDEHSISFLQKQIDALASRDEKQQVDIDSRVKYQHFTWILGILMMVVIGLLGVIYVQVRETSEAVSEMQKQMSLIQYRLDTAEVTK